MAFENMPDRVDEVEQPAAGQPVAAPDGGEVRPWEQISTGRYMPRRIKGSCKGRALG